VLRAVGTGSVHRPALLCRLCFASSYRRKSGAVPVLQQGRAGIHCCRQLVPQSIQSPFGSPRREETSKVNFHESFLRAGRVALLNKHAEGLFKGRLLGLVDGFMEITGDVGHHLACPWFMFAFLLA